MERALSQREPETIVKATFLSSECPVIRMTSVSSRDGDDPSLTTAAIPGLTAPFDDFRFAERAEQLVSAIEQAWRDTPVLPLMDELESLVSNAASCRRFEEALMLLDRVNQAVKSSRLPESMDVPLADLQSRIETARESCAAFEIAQQTLAVSPDDADAHFAVGQWLILEHDDWSQAVVHLANAGETSLWQTPAVLELSDVPDVQAIADAWRDLGMRLAEVDPFREKLLGHAQYWERRAAVSLALQSR